MSRLDALSDRTVRQVLARALRGGGDFAELFCEESSQTSLRWSDGRVRDLRLGTDLGAGVRVLHRGASGYAWCEGLSAKDLLEAAAAAGRIARGGGRVRSARAGAMPAPAPVPVATPFEEVAIERKIALLREGDEGARGAGGKIVQVGVRYADLVQEIRVWNSEGLAGSDERRLLEFRVTATAADRSGRQVGSEGCGAQAGWEMFDQARPHELGRKAARKALDLLAASPAPSGTMPVVIAEGSGDGGVLVHEAIGHALEADFVRSGASVYCGLLGRRVGSRHVSIVDDGTVPGLSGSIRVDDEGTPAARTVLIEEGILRGYMTDRQTARALRMPRTGNGRRESFRYPPQPRMTCTFLDRGPLEPEEVIAGVRRGLYVREIGGGRGDLVGEGFVFHAPVCFLIEKGKLTRPVKGVTLTGSGRSVLLGIEAVASDLSFEPGGFGRCGKMQWLPVSFGLPTVRIDGMTVGGTEVPA